MYNTQILPRGAQVNGRTPRGHATQVKIGDRAFPSTRRAIQYYRAIYRGYAWKDRVSPEHEAELRGLLAYHDGAAEKIGAGVDHFEVLKADHGTLCFYAVRIDGSISPFSFAYCVKCAARMQGRDQ
jgi:Protein of unknown function (DUF3223)